MRLPRPLSIGFLAIAGSLFFLASSARSAAAPKAAPAAPPSIADYTKGMERQEGYFPLIWDPARGRLLVEVPQPGEDFLYLTSAATGLGDPGLNIDLDRGSLVDQFLAHFERAGPRLHLVARNSRFRAIGGSDALARSVEESFPTSTLGAFEIVAESQGRVLADLTPLFLSDAVDVRGSLRAANQGSYSLDRDRCRIFRARTRAFPRNSEVEAALTFASDPPGDRLRGQSPDARSLTLRQHHSFVKLPDPGYVPRAFDPRIGVFGIEYYDFARRFDQDPRVRMIVRHRLEKRDPAAAVSEPVKPIVYYLDPAVPEPYRSAFREGARWWNRVFEAAGYRNALRIEDMRPDMDPLDARYHVILWTHRDDPGPSVGASLVDPRTGEIIKAAVRMDSHRSLVDYDLYAALLPALTESPAAAAAGLDWRLLGFVTALAGGCAIAFALAPAVRSTRVTLTAGLQDAARRGTVGSAPARAASASRRNRRADRDAPTSRRSGRRASSLRRARA